ncbi:MAG: hypothetical protein LHW59_11395, partial [Candidatus Cloacimonetes bacterium]|nr:hypothetical protein [Candidatus Cloacimonadota bacterium]
ELAKKMKAGNKLTAEEAKEYERLTRELVAVKNERRDMQKALENETKASQLNEKSLAAMRIQLSNLRKEFDKLDPASEKSKNLGLQINKLQTSINEADFSTKNFRGNVGNYSNSIMDALNKTGIFSGQLSNLGGVVNGLMSKIGGGSMGGAAGLVGSIGALGAGLIALPIAAVIGGFKMMKGYFESTAERSIELQASLTGLKGVMDDLKTSTHNFIEKSGFDKFLGNLTQGFVEQIGGKKAEVRYITREVLEESRLQAQRQLKFLETDYAKSEIRIQQLRTQAKQKDKYNEQERIGFLEEALKIEKDYTEKRVTLLTKIADATEALDRLSDTDQKQEEATLAARKAQYEAESAYYTNTRRMESELSTFRLEETRSREETFKKQREATLKETELYRQQQQVTEEILAGMRAGWDEEFKNLQLYENETDRYLRKIKEESDRVNRIRVMRALMGEEEIVEPETDALLDSIQTYDELQKKINTHRLSYAELRKEINKTVMTEQQAADMRMLLADEEARRRVEGTKMMVDMGTQLFREGTMAYKIFATAEATMATYTAATKALAEFKGFMKFAMAAMIIAKGLKNVAEINKVKFQKGGILDGPSHAQGGIPIRIAGRQIVEAEGGEIIVNKNIWTRPDYVQKISEMNYRTGGKRFAAGGVLPADELDFERIVDTIVNKIAAIPVVVSERDISSTQRKVLVTNNLGKI